MKDKNTLKAAFNLFSIFFYVAIFTIGGGIAMVPVLQRILVEKKEYLSEEEFTEVFSIAQVLPGSLMVNMATFTGYKILGFWGALFSCLAIMIPPLTIITLIAIFYTKFIQFTLIKKLMVGILAGVAGEVSGITLKMFLKTFKKAKSDTFKIILLVLSFALIFILKLNPIYVVIIGALLGIFLGRSQD
jgi:chromate transporter